MLGCKRQKQSTKVTSPTHPQPTRLKMQNAVYQLIAAKLKIWQKFHQTVFKLHGCQKKKHPNLQLERTSLFLDSAVCLHASK